RVLVDVDRAGRAAVHRPDAVVRLAQRTLHEPRPGILDPHAPAEGERVADADDAALTGRLGPDDLFAVADAGAVGAALDAAAVVEVAGAIREVGEPRVAQVEGLVGSPGLAAAERLEDDGGSRLLRAQRRGRPEDPVLPAEDGAEAVVGGRAPHADPLA